MKRFLSGLLAGLTFGVGLTLSGMTNPAKVQGFLDFFGNWDFSLLLVMVAAIGVHLPLYRLVLRRRAPLFAPVFNVPKSRILDGRLLVGASLFGVGWGLGGFCPGPAIVNATANLGGVITFAAMLFGVGLYEIVFAPRKAVVDHSTVTQTA